MTYTSQYPPAQSDTYVKATTKYSTSYWPYFATDPAKPLTGADTNNQWYAASGSITNQRFHIDLGSAKIIRRIYYENAHNNGSSTSTPAGIQNITFQGSNSAGAFAELIYATDTNWTNLGLDVGAFTKHVNLNQADPYYALVTNTIAYRYYALKIANNWGQATLLGVRRIELQTEDGYGVTFIPGAIWF